MSFFLLLGDEIRGFIKSKAMIVLWIGLPLLAIILHFIQPNTEGIPLSLFTGIMISSIGGLLAAVMLSTTLVNELNNHVYDLYLIRPVKRWHILVTKYLAIMLNLTVATFISLAIGLLIDHFTVGLPPSGAINDTLVSMVISLAAMSISAVAGILIGILVKSIAVAAILSIYLGQQLSILVLLPSFYLDDLNPLYFSLGVGVAVTVIILLLEIIVFNKKQF